MTNVRRMVATIALPIVTCALLAPAASAQQASGIAGAVRDGSGGVMPGVTVEAASPALIEKVRTAVTDSQGRYSIDDLRPGTYVVTFSLPGFRTTKREGIVLNAGFTATVNTDLQVGALEETITVTGAAPLVDTQNVRQQTVVSSKLLAALPSSTASIANLITLTVGMTGTLDVGGSSGLYKSNTPSANRYHGKAGSKNLVDGMNTMAIGVGMTYVVNMAAAEETTVDTGGASAESSLNGIQLNLVPKEGGNTFSFRTAGTYGGEHLQNDNLTDELRALGVNQTSRVYYVYDFNTTVGGPVKQDRLWFFVMNREAGNKNLVPDLYFNKTQGTTLYTPDLDRPAYRKEGLAAIGGRLTWQASQRNKVSAFVDVQHFPLRGRAEFASPEAYLYLHDIEPRLYQATWSSPMTSKLLLEAGASYMTGGWPYAFPGDGDFRVGPNDISVREASTGLQYNSKAAYNAITEQNRFAQRFSVSYVTGSHSYKAGIQTEVGISNSSSEVVGDVNYTFLRGVPNSITMRATPYLQKTREREIALFVQDRWTIDRLTLNYGLRFDSVNGWVPAQQVPARRFVPVAIDYAPVHDVPGWRDLNPRLGASYDLFGDGRTALKVSIGRYVEMGGGGLAGQRNPITTSVTSSNRTWNDTNGNYAPDCNLSNFAANGECGAIDNLNFGQNNPNATRFSDDVLRGSRRYTWDVTAEVQRELGTGISVTGGYYRNWSHNFRITDNLAVTSADYSPFCITTPVDARLPGGGGQEVCGLYDIVPAKFGRVENLVTTASQYYGPGSSANCGATFSAALSLGASGCGTSDNIAASVKARLPRDIQVGGGVDSGRTVIDNCFVVDSPQQLLNCRVVIPFKALTQVKAFGSVPLPGQFTVSATFKNYGGADYTADYQARNVEVAPTLGRDLAACGSRTGAACTATVTVPLITPMTQFLDRITMLDLRLSKILRLGSRGRLQANVDVYNLLNASTLIGVNNNYGPLWQRPFSPSGTVDSITPGRMIQFGGELSF